ncbi:MAG: mannitol dehydrogenase family protein, partial [Bradyrhizobium sp.]
PAGTDLSAYSATLLKRFSNPALHHHNAQIAMDGSQKLPQRLLGTLRDRLMLGLPIETHALAVAGWMRYVTGVDEQGREIDVRDPIAPELAAAARMAGPVADRLAPALLDLSPVFGTLGADPRVRKAITDALVRLYDLGASRAVQA